MLGDDRLAGHERVGQSVRVARLVNLADELHLDATRLGLPLGAVRERVEVDVAVELPVDTYEQVLVERGGDVRGIVVGRLEDGPVFLPIDADERRASRPDERPHPREERRGGGWLEVADGRAREVRERAAGAWGRRRQRERRGVVGGDGRDDEPWVPRAKPIGDDQELALGDVDRHVRRGGRERIEQQRRLLAFAAA